MLPQYGKLGPVAAEIVSGLCDTTTNFNGFRVLVCYCTDVAQRRSTKLCAMFRCLLGQYASMLHIYIHFQGLLPPDGILPGVEFPLHPSLAFSYIGNVTVRQYSNGRQPNFAVCCKEYSYGMFTDGATYITGRPSRWAWVSDWVSSFLTAHQHIIGHSVI